MLCAECEQKNPIEKPFKFCIRRSVTLCAECEQKNPIEKPFKFCIRRSVTLCAECEQQNPIEKPSKFGLLQKAALWPMALWPMANGLPIVQIHFIRAPLSLYASCYIVQRLLITCINYLSASSGTCSDQ